MEADDSNETELDGSDDGENDDYIEREEEGKAQEDKQLNILNGHDRLDDDDNEADLVKSMKLLVPYWDAYDTVNQLFLEISKYTSLFVCVAWRVVVCRLAIGANGLFPFHLPHFPDWSRLIVVVIWKPFMSCCSDDFSCGLEIKVMK